MSKLSGITKTLKNVVTHPLNRDRPVRALVKFAKWQIGSRLVPGEVVIDWIGGTKFYASPGESGITGNIYLGLHEYEDMSFLLHFLRPDDLFLDVGANVGSYTILAGGVIGAKCISFEPVPETFKKLSRNIRLNKIEENVKCINKGVGHENGKLFFTNKKDTTNHVVYDVKNEKSINVSKVDIVKLDSEIEKNYPSLIKIDVEGFEANVLSGAERILKNKKTKAVIWN